MEKLASMISITEQTPNNEIQISDSDNQSNYMKMKDVKFPSRLSNLPKIEREQKVIIQESTNSILDTPL